MGKIKYGYYPGCSLESTAKEYDLSMHTTAKLARRGTGRIARLELLRRFFRALHQLRTFAGTACSQPGHRGKGRPERSRCLRRLLPALQADQP